MRAKFLLLTHLTLDGTHGGAPENGRRETRKFNELRAAQWSRVGICSRSQQKQQLPFWQFGGMDYNDAGWLVADAAAFL